MAQSSPDKTFEEVWELARRLSPLDKVRLIERIAPPRSSGRWRLARLPGADRYSGS